MLKKVEENIEISKEITQFIVCGDSGCDGYNTEGIVVFETILNCKADFTVVVGDLVPVGSKSNFEFFKEIVDTSSKNDVYVLPGNHDINLYEEYCGNKDYYIKTENEIFVFLDNSKRYFSETTMKFLDDTLKLAKNRDIFILFHIPPKNPYLPNSISEDEWEKIKNLLMEYKEKVLAIFCGHIHASVEYILDGFRIIITGGAGSKFDGIENIVSKQNEYHYYLVEKKEGKWEIKIVYVPYHHSKIDYSSKDEVEVLMNLEKAFLGEAVAFRKYMLFAEIAEKEGYKGIAKLFRAASESEYYHAKNMLVSMNGLDSTLKNLEKAIENEKYESEEMYKKFSESAKKTKSNRAYNSFMSALEAEKVHFKLLTHAFEELKEGRDILEEKYYTCTRCGYTHKGDNPPRYCPGCGTDMFKFSKVEP